MISVIIPTLNEEKYIERTLKSLKDQDYNKKFEIIVADYKSKDSTLKIAKKYSDKMIPVKKIGASAGRNAGAKIAKGDIFVFLDADTIANPNLLGVIEKVFKNKKIIGATCPVVPLSAKIRDFMIFWFVNGYYKRMIIAKQPHASGMCFVCRADVFKEVNGFNESIRITEDINLAMSLKKYGRFAFIEDTFVLTSPRRIEKWGVYKAARVYVSNYLKMLALGKSSKRFFPVR